MKSIKERIAEFKKLGKKEKAKKIIDIVISTILAILAIIIAIGWITHKKYNIAKASEIETRETVNEEINENIGTPTQKEIDLMSECYINTWRIGATDTETSIFVVKSKIELPKAENESYVAYSTQGNIGINSTSSSKSDGQTGYIFEIIYGKNDSIGDTYIGFIYANVDGIICARVYIIDIIKPLDGYWTYTLNEMYDQGEIKQIGDRQVIITGGQNHGGTTISITKKVEYSRQSGFLPEKVQKPYALGLFNGTRNTGVLYYRYGESNGYENGQEVGYNTGYNKGYENGYNVGYAQASDENFNPISMIINPIAEFFSIKMFGNFAIGDFFTVSLFVAVALIFLKTFAGG